MSFKVKAGCSTDFFLNNSNSSPSFPSSQSLFSKRDPLALNSLVGADERKEAQDFIDLYGEEAFVSKLASFIEAGDLSAISKRAHPSDKFLFPAATVAFLASAFAGYESIKKKLKIYLFQSHLLLREEK